MEKAERKPEPEHVLTIQMLVAIVCAKLLDKIMINTPPEVKKKVIAVRRTANGGSARVLNYQELPPNPGKITKTSPRPTSSRKGVRKAFRCL